MEAVAEPRISTPEFATLLRSFERTLLANPPERVVLADDSDEAFAAALVATKLLIPVSSTADASRAATLNAVVIAQLASA